MGGEWVFWINNDLTQDQIRFYQEHVYIFVYHTFKEHIAQQVGQKLLAYYDIANNIYFQISDGKYTLSLPWNPNKPYENKTMLCLNSTTLDLQELFIPFQRKLEILLGSKAVHFTVDISRLSPSLYSEFYDADADADDDFD